MYVAPDGAIAAINVLVVEVSGLGPWDTADRHERATTPHRPRPCRWRRTRRAASFFIGGVGGDNVASGQAFAPAGWTPLATQTQSNGVDTTADNILTSAFLPSSVSNQSVSASASSAEDLSGFLLAVKVSGDSPIPANAEPGLAVHGVRGGVRRRVQHPGQSS